MTFQKPHLIGSEISKTQVYALINWKGDLTAENKQKTDNISEKKPLFCCSEKTIKELSKLLMKRKLFLFLLKPTSDISICCAISIVAARFQFLLRDFNIFCAISKFLMRDIRVSV